jgi:steroid 5-alpha reductase family enzyme
MVGFLVFAAGLVIESVADYQKYQFKKNNPKKWMSSGIWAYSRHPNYFGEIVVWVGVYLAAMPALSQSGKLIGLLGPAYITVILLFVSGVRLLEKRAVAKYGKDKAFREYQDKTSMLIPLPKRR